MKIFLSIFGILLMIFGGVIIYGIGIQLFKGTSETSLLFDITLIGVLGVAPLIIGIWLLGLGVKKKKVYYEKDNRGTREMTKSQADSYWLSRNAQQRFEPYLLYDFDSAEQAKAALLELPCIHLAKDTENLICTETLTFGYHQRAGFWSATIAGYDLTENLWKKAKAAFEKHGGRLKNDQKPEKKAKKKSPPKKKKEEVKFVREDRKPSPVPGKTFVYKIYKAPNAAMAKAFLEKNPVNQELFYIVVETPEGNYGRDIQGMYKE